MTGAPTDGRMSHREVASMRMAKKIIGAAAIMFLCGGPTGGFDPVIISAYAAPAPALKERMSDVSRAVMVWEGDRECGPGAFYTARYYNTRGDGNIERNDADLGLYFVKNAKKPYMAAIWSPPDFMQIDRLLMDLDLNGYADIVGQPFDEVFGNSPCDAFLYYLANRKP